MKLYFSIGIICTMIHLLALVVYCISSTILFKTMVTPKWGTFLSILLDSIIWPIVPISMMYVYITTKNRSIEEKEKAFHDLYDCDEEES